MRLIILSLAAASVLSAPARAASLPYDATDPSIGTFIGARFQMPLGQRGKAKPRTSLAFAPTFSRLSYGTVVKTTIGEGVRFDLGRRPSLTLAGLPADQALGLRTSPAGDAKTKQNLSTGGWIAVGAGVAAVAGGLWFLHAMDKAKDNSD
jgi:hypothetical protein